MDPRRDTLLAPPLDSEATVTGEIDHEHAEPPADAGDGEHDGEHDARRHEDAIARLRGVRPLTRPPFRPWVSIHDAFDPDDG